MLLSMKIKLKGGFNFGKKNNDDKSHQFPSKITSYTLIIVRDDL